MHLRRPLINGCWRLSRVVTAASMTVVRKDASADRNDQTQIA